MSLRALLLSLIVCFGTPLFLNAQCSVGQVEVNIDISTDGFGYEVYWELLPAANNCGNGTLFSGGNNAVGCFGGGSQGQTPGGYANNSVISEGPFCLVAGNDYKIYSVDDWGDGGASFNVYIEGFLKNQYATTGTDQEWIFKASEPFDYDGQAEHLGTPKYVASNSEKVIGEILNVGKVTWNTFEVLYSVDNGSPVSETFSGLSIPSNEVFEFEFSNMWSIPTTGDYFLKFWIGNINGNADQDNTNNELSKDITVSEPIPNKIDEIMGSTPVFEEIVSISNQVSVPRDLDFHPDYGNKQLWIINKGTENSGGSTVIIDNAGETNQFSQYVQDGNAWHFMSLPTAIAFSDNGNFATSPGVQDANHNNGTFTGPSLWPSDLSIYGIVGNPPSPAFNGSHLDMLHGSPFSMGIAHEKDNVFWVFDSHNQEMVRYDFKDDHGPGKDYHGDAIVRRYSQVMVERNGTHIPNHLVLDKNTDWLYIVENKNNRVLRLDIKSGSMLQNLPNQPPNNNEALEAHEEWTGVTLEVPIANITSPTGIEVIDDRLLVSEHLSGDIVAFDISGASVVEVGRIATGATELMGIKVGPEGNIWYVDAASNTVSKISSGAPTAINTVNEPLLHIYPNPTAEFLFIEQSTENTIMEIVISDVAGRVFLQDRNVASDSKIQLDLDLFPAGNYLMKLNTERGSFSYKFSKI